MAVLSAAVLAATPVTSTWEPSAQAAGAETEVHVGLYMKTKDYVSAEEAVTLSAEGGLSAVDELGREWFRAGAGESIRASVDGYRVVVAETADAALAESLVAASSAVQPLYGVFLQTWNGKNIYRVEAGPYATAAEADTALAKLAANAGVTKLTAGGAAMKLAGPYYADAGAYDSASAAQAAADTLGSAGVYAVPALTANGAGAVAYGVLIGGAASPDALQPAIAAAAGVIGAAPAQLAAETRYALLRRDVSGTGGKLGAETRHVSVDAAGGKLSFVPAAANGAVRVAERSNRSYRGAIDIFAHEGALAVINRVDMELYVASVVGSELSENWPSEALKAQAVAVRTYVLKQGWKHGIANVTDTTADQAYYGVEREFASALSAAQATAGERLTLPSGVLLDAFYHSNAGDRTADPAEAWGSAIAGIQSVPSLDDAAEKGKLSWYRIAMPDQRIGYVRSDLVSLSDTRTAGGFQQAVITGSGVNVREAPYANNETNPAIAQLSQGSTVTIIGEDMESTAYRWIRGPYTSDELLQLLRSSAYAPAEAAQINRLQSLSVTERGSVSGRVLEVAVNGAPLAVERSDHYRMIFGLPSNRFDIEETASVSVLGAGGRRTETAGSVPLAAIGAGGMSRTLNQDAYLIADRSGTARVATIEPEFRILGTGNGHGLGMSQWGAYGLAEIGYGYREILQYYYKDALIVKE